MTSEKSWKKSSKNEVAFEHVHTRDIFLKSDLHGLPDLYESYNQRRLFSLAIWTVVVVIATSLLIWQIIETWSDFLNNPILTSYSVQADARGIPFPQVVAENCKFLEVEQSRDEIFANFALFLRKFPRKSNGTLHFFRFFEFLGGGG
jgi:hypothetical protein